VEVETLMAHQWPDGMVPHIVFHEKDDGYFPGPDVWQTGRPTPTSGITQPPVLGMVLEQLYLRDAVSPQVDARCRALLQAGVPETCIDSPAADAAQFDSEALWQRVASQVKAGQPVLIVRGNDASATAEGAAAINTAQAEQSSAVTGTGRDWLAQQLQAAGASAQFVVAYERRAPAWSAEQQTLAAQAAADGTVWCFSSSQAIHHLAQAMPTQSWARARCIATHPRIAQTAHSLGFGEIQISKPSLADLLVSLESPA
jgi:uroporphyrinogen-III synthase